MSSNSGSMGVGYYVRVQGMVRGPFNLEQLQRMRALGQLQRFHEISGDRRQWIAAGSVKELFGGQMGSSQVPIEPQPIDDAMPPPPPPKPRAARIWAARAWPRWLNAKLALWTGGGLAAVVVAWLILNRLGGSTPPPPEAAVKILKDNCQQCHGDVKKGGTFHVAFRDSMVSGKAGDPADVPYLFPTHPDKSAIFLRIQDGSMPQKKPPLSARDQAILRDWILAGAEFPGTTGPPRDIVPITMKDVLRLVKNDLAGQPEPLRDQMRYFTLHQLHNQAGISAEKLNTYRGAVAKLMNSLSFHQQISPIVPVDKNKVVFRVHLPSYQWPAAKWEILVNNYPFGLDFEQGLDAEMKIDAQFIRQSALTRQAMVRGDWFVVHGAEPRLYHQLLEVPGSVNQLEKLLGVDTIRNIQSFQAKRAGFGNSGVSKQNRLIERHVGKSGYYWVSYDFGPDNPRADLFQFPLGPRGKGLIFKDNKNFDDLAFAANGGEIIFCLPNQLQGYMLINESGTRIDNGPPEVVIDRDSAEPIVNGLSCFGCHDKGIKRKDDEIRARAKVPLQAREALELLYPGPKEIARLFDQDEKTYLDGLQRAYQGAFAGEMDGKEPIITAHRHYQERLDLARAALELDFFFDPEDPRRKIDPKETLRQRILNNFELKQKLGLGPLATDGGTVARSTWDQNFPAIVRALGIAEPLIPAPADKSRKGKI